VCYGGIVLSAIVWELQGVTLTLAMMDVISKKYISGSAKLVYGVVVSAIMGFGMDLGTSTFISLVGVPKDRLDERSRCNDAVEPVWYPLLFLIACTGFIMLENGHPSQIVPMVLVAALSFVTYNFTHPYSLSQLSTVLASIIARVTALQYGRMTKQPSILYYLPAVYTLVPEEMAFSAVQVLNEDPGGYSLTLGVILTSISLALGLFLASALVPWNGDNMYETDEYIESATTDSTSNTDFNSPSELEKQLSIRL
jgi:uncharacterized membrane protein YjjB (DUF3815 family)